MADVMICHGGPGSIADAWARGLVPIVVPRLRRFGEVVDDHQVDFCRKLAGLGRIRLAQAPDALAEFLDEAARDYTRFRAESPEADTEAAVKRFGELVDELVSRPRRRLPLIHRSRRSPSARDRRRRWRRRRSVAGPGPGSEYRLAGKRLGRTRRPRWDG